MSNHNVKVAALQEAIDDVKAQLDDHQYELDNFEYNATEDEYDDFLNDSYPTVNVCGHDYDPAYALKELDPYAYRMGKSDYESGIDLEDVSEYIDIKDAIVKLEDELADLEYELDELFSTGE